MSNSPEKDSLDEAKRIMGRLVKMPHKLHKDEPTRQSRQKGRRSALERRKSK